MEQKIHQGRNVKRFREMLGIKQEALAYALGEEWNQKKVSLMEQKESIETTLLGQISGVLNIPVEAFQNFNEEQAVNIIANTFDNGSILNGINHNPTFHPIDKLVQLHEEKIALYERMLKEKDAMMLRLEELIAKKQRFFFKFHGYKFHENRSIVTEYYSNFSNLCSLFSFK